MKGHAFTDLFKRHVRVLRQAWTNRRELDTPGLLPHEVQFLPAALALRDTPVHPAPRIALWLIMAFALIAVLWASLGQTDIVAMAPGKVIPDARTKLIQPVETAVVRAIHVRDGQAVEAGQLLVELDATSAAADSERLVSEALAARLEEARAVAMLSALRTGKAPRLDDVEGADAARMVMARSQLSGQYQEYQARQQQWQAEVERREGELQVIREQIAKLEQTAPIARKRAEDFGKLVKENFMSEHGYLEREQARIELEQDLAGSRAKLAESNAALVQARREQATLVAETTRQLLDQQSQAAQKAASLGQERVKAEQRGRLMRLTAPVAGTVQQLAVHTVGGVVTAAQPLMVIVPKENVLEVEAWLPNKDIGFVNVGQVAEVKVEAFPFTKYGSLPGRVIQVSADAIQDEKRGLVYATRVRLARDTLRMENRAVRLTPGMAVTVEVRTGQRRVIEYFLDPLIQVGRESLRER
jgi:hemolysin D